MKRLLFVLAACHGGAAEHGGAEAVRTAAVAKGVVADRVLLTGELHAAAAVDLSVPRTDSWQLAIRWMAEDGTQVKQGDRVLEFDNSAFTAQLDQKKLALREAESTAAGAHDLAALESETKAVELHQHQLALDKATVKADVPVDLLTGRDAQERQLEKKRMASAVHKAEQDLVAQKQEAQLDAQVKQIEVDKAKRAIDAAEKSISELVVMAPRDGILVIDDHPWEGRKFHIGDTVQPGMTIMSLPDPAAGMQVLAELSDVDDGRVRLGDVGTCTLDAYPGEQIECKVDQLTPVARPKGGRGSLRRAFAVVLVLGKTDATRMRPGMSVKVELARAAVKDVVVVPRGAIAHDDKGAHVRLASGEARAVQLGACDAQGCEVKTGLGEGDKVQIGGAP